MVEYQADENENYIPTDLEQQQIDEVVQNAIAHAESGAPMEEILHDILPQLPANLRTMFRKRLIAAAQQSTKLRAMINKPVAASRPMSLAQLAVLMAKSAMDKIAGLMSKRPDVKQRIEEAGKVLMRNGVVVDMVKLSEADLGAMSPGTGVGQQVQQGAQR